MIPKIENALILRTEFSDQAAWRKITDLVRKPVGIFRFRANVDFLDDPAYAGITLEEVLALLPRGYPHTFIFLVDQVSVRSPDHPLLVVDLYDQRGRFFRAIPKAVQAIENNLSIANMDFDEFASAVDESGVFRSFPGDRYS